MEVIVEIISIWINRFFFPVNHLFLWDFRNISIQQPPEEGVSNIKKVGVGSGHGISIQQPPKKGATHSKNPVQTEVRVSLGPGLTQRSGVLCRTPLVPSPTIRDPRPKTAGSKWRVHERSLTLATHSFHQQMNAGLLNRYILQLFETWLVPPN